MDISTATTRPERAACFHAHMARVAAALDGFVYKPSNDPEANNWQAWGELTSGKVRATLRVSMGLDDFHNKVSYKVTAGGVYPRTAQGQAFPNYGDDTAPLIHFQLTRPASQIAADLTRRLLPAYQSYYEKAAKWIAATDAYAASIEATRHEMQELGFNFSAHAQSEGYMPFPKGHQMYLASPGVHVYAGYADIKLKNLTPAQVRDVLQVLGLLPELHYV